MRYISLTDTELLTLQEGQRNHRNAVFRQRCSCLLLSYQGCRILQLAKLYQTRTHTIRTWFDRYEQMGLVGLRVLPGRGRKSVLQASHQSIVEAALATNRQSLKQVSLEVSQQVGQAVSKGQLKAFLKSWAGVGTAFAKVSSTNKTQPNMPLKKPN
jgi:transposase